jgi:salicylate hydroxylase
MSKEGPPSLVPVARDAVRRAKSPDDWYDVAAWLYGSTELGRAISRDTLFS